MVSICSICGQCFDPCILMIFMSHISSQVHSGRCNSISGIHETKISIHVPMPKFNLGQKSSFIFIYGPCAFTYFNFPFTKKLS